MGVITQTKETDTKNIAAIPETKARLGARTPLLTPCWPQVLGRVA
jgi:hypothetical protein